MTPQEFFDKYNNIGIDDDGAYGFQCMDLAHRYAKEVNGSDFDPAPAAKDVWNETLDKYDKIANTPDGVPQTGDIVIWGTGVGPYGHIAIFDHGDQNSFTSFDQNWPLNSLCHYQNHNYNGVLGWLHFRGTANEGVPAQELTISKSDFDSLHSKADLYDAFAKDNFNSVEDIHKAIDELVQAGKDKDAEIAKKDAEIADLNTKLGKEPQAPQTPPVEAPSAPQNPTLSWLDKLFNWLR